MSDPDKSQDPYVYPGTNVLRNKFDFRESEKLAEVENFFFALKSAEPLPQGNLDYIHLKAIHQHFFNAIYEWAGQERTVDIAKGDSYFAHTSYITSSLNKLFNQLKNENYLQNWLQVHKGTRSFVRINNTLNLIYFFIEN